MTFAFRRIKRHITKNWPEYLTAGAASMYSIVLTDSDVLSILNDHKLNLIATYGGGKLLQLMNKDSLRGFVPSWSYYIFKGIVQGFFGDQDEKLKAWEKASTIKDLPDGASDMAILYAKTGNTKEAIRKSLGYLSMQDKMTFFSKQAFNPLTRKNIESLEKKLEEESTLNNKLPVIINSIVVQKYERAIQILKESIDVHKEYETELKILYGKLLKEIKDSKHEQVFWEVTTSIVLNKDNFHEPIGESTNPVYDYNDMIITKLSDKKTLEEQVESANIIKEITKGHKEYEVIETINSDGEVKDQSALLMMRRKGHILWEDIQKSSAIGILLGEKQKKKFEHKVIVPVLERVVDYLAFLHVNYPKENLKQFELGEYAEKIQLKLDSLVPRHLTETIIKNYGPVVEAFSLGEAKIAYNKDAHPKNWNIWPYNVIEVLDTEKRKMTPVQFDLANLLEYDGLSKDTKNYIIEEYIRAFNKHSKTDKIKDKKEFLYVYHNAVIQRALSIYESLSKSTTGQGIRKDLISNALNSIGILKAGKIDSSEWHENYWKKYNVLDLALRDLKNRIKT